MHRLRAILALSLLLAAAVPSICREKDAVYEPDTNATVHIWTGTEKPGFVYPEQSAGPFGMPALTKKPNFGIAVSGGGYRATTLAYGWLRALRELGVVEKARYLGSNSGGSWFNGAFSYTQVPMSQFFDAYLLPQNITLDVAKKEQPGSYGEAIAKASIVGDALTNIAGEVLSGDKNRVRLWSDAVGEAFLEPFGVGAQASSITALGTRGRVHERVANIYPNLTMLTATSTPDRPYPIILGSLYRKEEAQRFFPIEFTPLYTGIPSAFPKLEPPLGGGFTEPLGLNSNPVSKTNPGPSPDGTKTVLVDSKFSTPLVTMVGISSSFVSQGATPDAEFLQLATGTEVLDYWGPLNFTATESTFADGGGIDNLAVTPLLRRKVQHIIVAVAAVVHPNTTADEWAIGQYDIAGLFGATPENSPKLKHINNVSVPEWNKNLQVFPKAEWATFYKTISGLVKQGKPASFRTTYPVVANQRQAVQGGWAVDILWLVNAQIQEWEDSLPKETSEVLTKHRSGKAGTLTEGESSLKTYPYITTYDANYDPLLVTLLSQQASYQVMQMRKEIEAMASPAA